MIWIGGTKEIMRNLTLSFLSFTFFIVFTTSCDDTNSIQKEIALPAKEIHYDGETGERIGETVFTYDSNGKVVREYYSDSRHPANDREKRYEYDNDGRIVNVPSATSFNKVRRLCCKKQRGTSDLYLYE